MVAVSVRRWPKDPVLLGLSSVDDTPWEVLGDRFLAWLIYGKFICEVQ